MPCNGRCSCEVTALVYSSRAIRPMLIGDLDALAGSARVHNDLMAVTGMLLYLKGRFLQHIEGHDRDVVEVFERIEADSRHTGIRVLSHEPIVERRFPSWSMGFDAPDQSALGLWLASRPDPTPEGPVPAQLIDSGLCEALLDVYAT